MPKFRFTATDRAGLYKSGVVDADDARDARDILRERGFQVRELVDVSTPSSSPEPLDLGDDTPPPSRSRRRPAAEPRSSSGGAGKFTLVLAVLTFLLAAATAGYVVYRDPPWGRLSRYDFSTPEGAQRSHLQMERNGDIQAMIELNRKIDRRKTGERLESLSVKKTVEFQGKKGLFTTYKIDGKTKKTVEWFEKDADSGYWKPTFVSPFEMEKTDKAQAEEVKKWQAESEPDDPKW